MATINTNNALPRSSSGREVGHHKTDATFIIRPFDSSVDQEQLNHICRNVYGGTDYLPSQAIELENDPTCTFQVLVAAGAPPEKGTRRTTGTSPSTTSKEQNDEKETLLAVANVRALDGETGWLEAVRTNEDYRGRGFATHLIQDIFHKTLQGSSSSSPPETAKETNNGCNNYCYNRVMSMTIESNFAMQRVFDRLGMTKTNNLRISDFSRTSQLPGYAATRTDLQSVSNDDEPETCCSQNLLDALKITNLIPNEAKKAAELWEPITSTSDLQRHLKDATSTGMMPGAWKVMSPETTQCLQESIDEGLVFVMMSENDESSSRAEDHHHHHPRAGAVMALVKDAKSVMPTIKSPWILCLAGSTELHLYSALWHACFSDDIQNKLRRGMMEKEEEEEEEGNNVIDCKELKETDKQTEGSLSDEAGFVMVFDDDIPINDDMTAKLLLREERPVVYSTNLC